jgi:rhodanese-related sulfurtransferase/CBS domain-containing protein
MPRTIDREEVQRLVGRGAQLVEALPPNEYEEDHLPGAINLPLRKLETEAERLLDPRRPIVVYCEDSSCDLSPRAAWRLESMGFTEVYDYADGKLDWMGAGLPTEGANAARPRAGDVARTDVPTCGMDERAEDVRERVRSQGWDACVVVNEERVVLGLLRSAELASGSGPLIRHAMRPGPSTFRPSVGIEEMVRFMTEHDLVSSPVTTSDGRLVGLLLREDAVKAADDSRRRAEAA